MDKKKQIGAAGGIAAVALVIFLAFTLNFGPSDPPPDTTTTRPPASSTTTEPPASSTTTEPPTDQAVGPFHVNPAGLDSYTTGQRLTFQELTSSAAGKYGPVHNPDFTNPAPVRPPAFPQGQFRKSCAVSHFDFVDPIIHPFEPAGSHLHMIWGNTGLSAFTKIEFPPDDSNPDSLMAAGGSSCAGGPLNRSAYWTPAMQLGNGDLVMPELITLYYKSHQPSQVRPLPPGVKMLAPADFAGGELQSTFRARESLHWGCNNGSKAINISNVIPGTAETEPCPSWMKIQATIQFPQCFKVNDDGTPVLSSDDFVSHLYILEDQYGGRQNDDCPSSHPYRAPQISYLIKYRNPGPEAVKDWRLSSDYEEPDGTVPNPGGSLHADWAGGWHPDAIQSWIDGCFIAASNCSLGLLGDNDVDLQLRRITGDHLVAELYRGPQILPCGADCRPRHDHSDE